MQLNLTNTSEFTGQQQQQQQSCSCDSLMKASQKQSVFLCQCRRKEKPLALVTSLELDSHLSDISSLAKRYESKCAAKRRSTIAGHNADTVGIAFRRCSHWVHWHLAHCNLTSNCASSYVTHCLIWRRFSRRPAILSLCVRNSWPRLRLVVVAAAAAAVAFRSCSGYLERSR